MTTREKLLALFEANKGVYFSGEELAESLSVSRTAVWKAVKSLRNEGYSIDAVTNKGYCLSVKTDILSPQGIRKYLKPEYQSMQLEVLPAVTSTNAVLREQAASEPAGAVQKPDEQAASEPTREVQTPDVQNAGHQAEGYQLVRGLPESLTVERVVVANQQTRGRGRYGRTFYSPEDTGVYMSLLLKPHCYSASQAVRFTTMAAVAMCEAIEEVSDEQAQIKWVNDIFVRDRKVCGILTEGSFDMESGALDYAVLGVGVNVYPPEKGFPEELSQTAGSIFESKQDDMKNRLTAAFLNHFQTYYRAKEPSVYTDKYRERSLAMNKDITVISGSQTRKAHVYGIDEACRLQVKYEDGETESLSCGEIRILI